MKLALFAVFAACLAVPAGSRVQEPGPITVKAPAKPHLPHWIQTVGTQIERSLESRSLYRSSYSVPDGAVAIRFMCGADGKPANVTVYRRSGERELDRIAAKAVARIETLHPMPAQIGAGQMVQANIFFAEDRDTLKQLKRQQAGFDRDDARHLASQPSGAPQVVMLEINRRTGG